MPAPDPRTPGLVSGAVRGELQEAMTAYAGVLRSASGLAEASVLLDKLTGNASTAVDQESWETTNLLTVSAALAAAAALREETRGSHWRDDFPDRDDAQWSGHFDTVLVDGTAQLSFTPAAPTDRIDVDGGAS